jgi:signal transduction histidine kinase/DNA-binding response OmpR family regulator
MKTSLLGVKLSQDNHIVLARQQAREVAGLLGFDSHDQTRIATAVSEVARDILNHTGSGEIEFSVEGQEPEQLFIVLVKSKGIGISDIKSSVGKKERPLAGLDGIDAARRLMEQFQIEQEPDGRTTVTLRKRIPHSSSKTQLDLAKITSEIARRTPKDPVEEIRQQNLELVSVLEALRLRQDELTALNQELEDTNRGVVALYAELEERAEYLKKAHEIKSRSLSEMSHELRTPINSIIAITRILLDRTDGDLTEEQEKQLGFIKSASQNLSELINNLLDLSKIEAGKTKVQATHFEVRNLFGALRSMLKPLLYGQPVDLVFEDPDGIPTIFSDEGKVSQILRNLVSNAIKFTEHGEVRVSTFLMDETQTVTFGVFDSGIGIAPEHKDLIFEEFGQVEGPLQSRFKGTGLGLPLARKLAEMLGGTISCECRPEGGSVFWFTLPVQYGEVDLAKAEAPIRTELDTMRRSVLVVEDDPATLFAYEGYLRRTAFQVIPARSVAEARELLRSVRPAAIVLDILLPDGDGWGFLSEIKHDKGTMNIPVLICSVVDEPGKAMVLGAQDYCTKPIPKEWILEKLTNLAPAAKILVIDDDPAAQYVLKKVLTGTMYSVIEASDGEEGLRLAQEEQPDIICLDLIMPGMNGFETLRLLKLDPATSHIPVIIVTSKNLDEEERRQLGQGAISILQKEGVSRMAAMEKIKEALIRVPLK